MSHRAAIDFLKDIKKYKNLGGSNFTSILEIGSYDVNGTVRSLFQSSKYVGVDLIEGPGVDIVTSGHDLNLPEKSIDLCLSSEVFEHNPYWKETLANMFKVLRPDGVMVITCASTGRYEHGTDRTNPSDAPGLRARGWDYYHNISKKEFLNEALKHNFSDFYIEYSFRNKDLYFWAVKADVMGGFGKQYLNIDFASLRKRNSKNRQPIEKKFFFIRLSLALINLPLTVLPILVSDRLFQNFQIKYRNLVIRIINKSRRIFKSK